MTRVFARTIPSSYVRIDDQVTAADEYLNVRDLQRWFLNHNILLARRCRRPIYACNQVDSEYTLGATTRSAPAYSSFHELDYGNTNDWYLNVPIQISPWVQQLELVIDGVAATGTVYVYPEIGSEETAAIASSAYVASVTTSSGQFNVTIDLPPTMYNGRTKDAWFRLNVICAMDGSDLGSDEGVLDYGDVWVETDATTTSATVGSVMYGVTDALFHPRMVTGVEDLGSTTKIWVREPIAPGELTVGTSDVNFQDTYQFSPNYIGIYELGVSDFNAEVEPAYPES